MSSLESEPGLYLILPPAFAPARIAPDLDAALATGAVAAVLLWLESEVEAEWAEAVDMLQPLIHGHGVPLLLGGKPVRAAQLGADGLHLEASVQDIRAAVEAETPRRMVGAGGLLSRHNAMLSGETGVDYVLFGSANPARREACDPDKILELAGWWAEIFQVPCAAIAETAEQADALAEAGANFVAVRDLVWADAQGAESAVIALRRRLKTLALAS